MKALVAVALLCGVMAPEVSGVEADNTAAARHDHLRMHPEALIVEENMALNDKLSHAIAVENALLAKQYDSCMLRSLRTEAKSGAGGMGGDGTEPRPLAPLGATTTAGLNAAFAELKRRVDVCERAERDDQHRASRWAQPMTLKSARGSGDREKTPIGTNRPSFFFDDRSDEEAGCVDVAVVGNNTYEKTRFSGPAFNDLPPMERTWRVRYCAPVRRPPSVPGGVVTFTLRLLIDRLRGCDRLPPREISTDPLLAAHVAERFGPDELAAGVEGLELAPCTVRYRGPLGNSNSHPVVPGRSGGGGSCRYEATCVVSAVDVEAHLWVMHLRSDWDGLDELRFGIGSAIPFATPHTKNIVLVRCLCSLHLLKSPPWFARLPCAAVDQAREGLGSAAHGSHCGGRCVPRPGNWQNRRTSGKGRAAQPDRCRPADNARQHASAPVRWRRRYRPQ